MTNAPSTSNDECPAIRRIQHSWYLSFGVVILLFSFASVMAQSAKELSNLTKEELIEMATAKIDDPSFRLIDFTEIDIWLEDNELTVEFGHIIQFIPR